MDHLIYFFSVKQDEIVRSVNSIKAEIVIIQGENMRGHIILKS